MSQGTYEIAGLGNGPAPFDVPVNSVNGFDLLSVFATFDGSGAAGDFLPVVQVLSAAGHVMAQTFGSAVTAGDSADVTFGPFLRTATQSSGGGITQITSSGGSITVTNPFGPVVDLATSTAPITQEFLQCSATLVGAGASASLNWQHSAGSSLVDLTAPATPTFKAKGIYSLSGAITTGENIGAGQLVVANVTAAVGTFPAVYGGYTGPVSNFPAFIPLALTARYALNDQFVGGVQNQDTIVHNFADAQTFVLTRIAL